MTDDTRAYSRAISLSALVEDPLFASLFLPEPDLIKRIAANMRTHGFDPHRPIDVWKDGAGRGKHIILEGHQRVAAAKRAGLTEVRVAYRDPATRLDALLWAAEQQAGRRNVLREVQCLSLLRALQGEPRFATATTKELSAQLKFATATIDRCRQLLKHGTQAEVLEVLEGTHGLKEAYDRLRQRRGKAARTEAAPVHRSPKHPPVVTALRTALAKTIEGGLLESPEALRHARWLLDYLDGHAPDLPSEDESDEDA
jgi:hypothetical protein